MHARRVAVIHTSGITQSGWLDSGFLGRGAMRVLRLLGRGTMRALMSRDSTDTGSSSVPSTELQNMSDPAAIELADLADDVLREVIEVRRRYEELERVLETIESRKPGTEASHDAEDWSPVAAEALSPESSPNLGAARSIASTAALYGASRREVEVYLREELGMEDSAAALDEIFSHEAPSEKRKR